MNGDKRVDQVRRAWLAARSHPLLPGELRDAVDQVVMLLGELELRVFKLEDEKGSHG